MAQAKIKGTGLHHLPRQVERTIITGLRNCAIADFCLQSPSHNRPPVEQFRLDPDGKGYTSRPIEREASQAGASTLTNSPMPTSQQVGKRPDFEETNMDSVLRVLAGEKRQRFFGHLRATEVLPDHHLIRVARASSQYPATLRAAALRHLVSRAPLEVTLGRPFSERRRLTRAHHGI